MREVFSTSNICCSSGLFLRVMGHVNLGINICSCDLKAWLVVGVDVKIALSCVQIKSLSTSHFLNPKSMKLVIAGWVFSLFNQSIKPDNRLLRSMMVSGAAQVNT